MFKTLTDAQVNEMTGVDITREFDKVKSKIFLGNNAAFLASVMTSLEFYWTTDIKTAATNGAKLWWNPNFFLNMPFEARLTVLLHELWHAALLHIPRMGNRDNKIWNIACDIRINNGLENDGFSFKSIEDCCKDQNYGLMSEEDIYNDLMQNALKIPVNPMWGNGPCVPSGSGGPQGNQGAQGQPQPGNPNQQGNDPNQTGSGQGDQFDDDYDMIPCDRASNMAAVNNVVRAIHQAKMAGQPGSIPGGLEQIIEKFLRPVVPWETLFQRWMKELLDEDYTWKRPNRRYQDIYLPSRFQNEGRLEHLIFYQDTSGSMTDAELLRNNSEIKYIQETMNPKRLTVVQFDTVIHRIDEFKEGDRYERMVINGRGGTDLRQVREHIIANRPTAAVIFTDLYVNPMEKLPFSIPVLWVTPSQNVSVPFGQLIYIRD